MRQAGIRTAPRVQIRDFALADDGQSCREPASIIVVQFGGAFQLCAACALRALYTRA